MRFLTLTSGLGALALVASPFACSGSTGSSPAPSGSGSTALAWDCGQASVPNGSAVECTATASSAVSEMYVCVAGNPDCPPADVDAGAPVGQGGGVVGGSDDAGSCACSEDAGAPVGQGGGHGNGSSGSGNGNGNGGGNGNGNGSSSGSSSGGSVVDAGCSGAPPTGGGDGSWQCTSDGNYVSCQQPPACDPGTHPSACGACIPDDACDDDCVPPGSGGCWVTGGGFIAENGGQDSFGGNAMPMKSGTIRGEWEDVDHVTGDKAHGEAQYLYCRHVAEPGPGQPSGPSHNFDINQVYFGGPARWFSGGAWADGYWFDVMAEDHGEGKGKNAGGPDFYHVTVRKMAGNGVSGAVVFDQQNDLGGGNIQIHPPNNGHPYTSSSLPSWVSLQP